ncbi:MAG: hypothetical protein L0216_17010 [Planctomycetales bacterium]|nr:hypothetical protein [Planctomycetales bacterium]
MNALRFLGMAVLAVSAGAAGCGGKAPAATPDEVFTRGKEAAAADRVSDLLDLFPPDDRVRVCYQIRLGATVLAASKGGEAEACRQELDEILKSHSVQEVPPPSDIQDMKAVAEAAAKALDGVDAARLFEALVRFWDKYGAPGSALTKKFQGELKDLKVEGEWASGTVEGKKIVFRKVGEGWYLNPELK